MNLLLRTRTVPRLVEVRGGITPTRPGLLARCCIAKRWLSDDYPRPRKTLVRRASQGAFKKPTKETVLTSGVFNEQFRGGLGGISPEKPSRPHLSAPPPSGSSPSEKGKKYTRDKEKRNMTNKGRTDEPLVQAWKAGTHDPDMSSGDIPVRSSWTSKGQEDRKFEWLGQRLTEAAAKRRQEGIPEGRAPEKNALEGAEKQWGGSNGGAGSESQGEADFEMDNLQKEEAVIARMTHEPLTRRQRRAEMKRRKDAENKEERLEKKRRKMEAKKAKKKEMEQLKLIDETKDKTADLLDEKQQADSSESYNKEEEISVSRGRDHVLLPTTPDNMRAKAIDQGAWRKRASKKKASEKKAFKKASKARQFMST